MSESHRFTLALMIGLLAPLNVILVSLKYPADNKVHAASLIDDSPVNRKVLVLNFNPTLENQGGLKLTQYKNWTDPNNATTAIVNNFPEVSGNYLTYTIQENIEIDGIRPKPDGYQYTDETYLACLNGTGPCHSLDGIDYGQLFSDYNVCAKNVDEVWLWGGPYFGYQEYNPVTVCGKTQFVMGFNYERALGEAMHDFGHRMEYVGINRVGDGGWIQDEANEWNKFSLIAGHCGNIHYPPGSTIPTDEYNYSRTRSSSSDCTSYLNYPTGSFTPETFNCSVWGCNQYGYVRWWLSNVPKNPSYSNINGKYLYHNWWKYFVYFDESAEGISGTPIASFSNLSSTFYYPAPAVFSFSYPENATFTIDMSTVPDMSTDVYLGYASGSSSPITITNPTKWDKYSCDSNLYWRIRSHTGITSPIQTTLVDCATPTSTPTVTPKPIGSDITVFASGTAYENIYPTMQLDVNGTIVKSWNVTASPSAYIYNSPTKITKDLIKVRFTNDRSNNKQNRNLFVDKITLDNVTYQSESPTTYSVGGLWNKKPACSAGYKSTEWLDCNGYFQY